MGPLGSGPRGVLADSPVGPPDGLLVVAEQAGALICKLGIPHNTLSIDLKRRNSAQLLPRMADAFILKPAAVLLLSYCCLTTGYPRACQSGGHRLARPGQGANVSERSPWAHRAQSRESGGLFHRNSVEPRSGSSETTDGTDNTDGKGLRQGPGPLSPPPAG